MQKFEQSTKYLTLLQDNEIGTWIFDKENDGSIANSIQFPYVKYSQMVNSFVEDVYEFSENNKDFALNKYNNTLKENGIEWDMKSMTEVDVSLFDANIVTALIMGAVRAERFCDGALLKFFQNGSIKKWLERLKEIDIDSSEK